MQAGLAFPLGGFVNQRVHSFIKGCLTLKCSESWKTVTGSSPDFAGFAEGCLESSSVTFVESVSFAGEIGMVSSGTGELGSAAPLRVRGVCKDDMMANGRRLYRKLAEKCQASYTV